MQKKPALAVAAAVVKAAATLGSPAYVFSTRSKKVLNAENASAEISKHKFAEYSCQGCSTHFRALANADPFCMVCGSEDIDRGAEVDTQNVHDDQELTSITCSGCGVANVTHTAVAKAVQGSCHCAACGAALVNITVAAEGEQPMPEVDVTDEQTADDQVEDVVPELEDETDTTGLDLEDSDVDLDAAADAADAALDLVEGVDEGLTESADADEMPNNEYNVDEQANDATEVDVNMLDVVDDEDETDIVAMGEDLAITSGAKVVAVLTATAAGSNADIMHSSSFVGAVKASIKDEGLRGACANFSFAPVKVKAKVSKLVAAQVEAQLAQERAKLDDQRKAMIADFKQSIDLAAVGLNKSFWKNVANPLRAAFVTELSSRGVRGSEKLVAKIFDQQGLAYANTLVTQATSLLARSHDARNELAEALDMVGVLASEDEDEDQAEDFESAVAASLSDEDVKSITKKQTAASGIRHTSAVQSILGGDPTPLFN